MSLISHRSLLSIFCLLITVIGFSKVRPGAQVGWITYEAEKMQTNGTVLGPLFQPNRLETESSRQQCTQLRTDLKQYVSFVAKEAANTMVIRYSLPDNKEGTGTSMTLKLTINSKLTGYYQLTSKFCHLYGDYPFSNDPKAGKHRNFYDELQIKDIIVAQGDKIRLEPINLHQRKQYGEIAKTCAIDLVDMELIGEPLRRPANSVSLLTYQTRYGSPLRADVCKSNTARKTIPDYTDALRKCIAHAARSGEVVWIPAGEFQITGDITIPSGVRIQGAGMWYTTLMGNALLYNQADKRVRIIGHGSNIHIADLAIKGKLNYRSDEEANDGIVGSFGENSTLERLWIEHTKVGMWLENSSHLLVKDCRLRCTIADGINFCVGMYGSTIENCSARGTGDDCFAIWPATFLEQRYKPGYNHIQSCLGQLPFLANGIAIYGGENNKVENCLMTDITAGSAILISTTFPTEAQGVHNNFSGTTQVQHCAVVRSGGFDHEWGWRGALDICLDQYSIDGIQIKDLVIDSSLSNAMEITGSKTDKTTSSLSNASFAQISIGELGLGHKPSFALYLSKSAKGALIIQSPGIQFLESPSLKSPSASTQNVSKVFKILDQ